MSQNLWRPTEDNNILQTIDDRSITRGQNGGFNPLSTGSPPSLSPSKLLPSFPLPLPSPPSLSPSKLLPSPPSVHLFAVLALCVLHSLLLFVLSPIREPVYRLTKLVCIHVFKIDKTAVTACAHNEWPSIDLHFCLAQGLNPWLD